MRVLILADDCNPEWPSLPIVGYKAARAIAEHADVVVATHIRNRPNINKVGLGRATVRYFDTEYVARPMFKIAKWIRGGTNVSWTTATALAYPSYLAFEWEVWKATRDELNNREFDIVHRLTPMSPTLPSPMAAWSPAPFVLGPLNGGLKWPSGFFGELVREREWLSYARTAHRGLPYFDLTYRKSSVVLAGFEHTINDLPEHARAKTINFPEVGIDRGLFYESPSRAPISERTILFVGRFVPYKLPRLVVRAFADQAALHSHRLIMIGDGPERHAIEQIIHSRGLENRVDLLGWKTQAEVASLMRKAHIFAFPSIRELGAGVVVEAMACGLACVVVDYGAPGALVDNDRGVKIPLGQMDDLTQRFGDALLRLISNDRHINMVGSAARQYAIKYYTWEAKALKMLEVYDWALRRGAKPDFWA